MTSVVLISKGQPCPTSSGPHWQLCNLKFVGLGTLYPRFPYPSLVSMPPSFFVLQFAFFTALYFHILLCAYQWHVCPTYNTLVLCPDPTLSRGKKGSGDLRPITRASWKLIAFWWGICFHQSHCRKHNLWLQHRKSLATSAQWHSYFLVRKISYQFSTMHTASYEF